MATFIGVKACWGTDPRWATLPIINLFADTIKIRRKLRSDMIARAYLQRGNMIQEWALGPMGDIADCTELRLLFLMRVNTKCVWMSPALKEFMDLGSDVPLALHLSVPKHESVKNK